MNRRQHRLSQNHANETPTEMMFVDTEAHIEHVTETLDRHTLRLGYALFIRRRWRNGKLDIDEDATFFRTIEEFWDFVESHTRDKTQLYLYAHNWNYDAGIVAMATEPERRGWERMRYVNEGPPLILKFKREKSSILVLDTLNYFGQALAAIGKAIGIEKGEIENFETATDEELMPYNERDTRIIAELMLAYLAFIEENDLGNYQPTLASQAFSAFRHRFMQPGQIFIHDRERVCELERAAYHGGRTECFHIGRVLGSLVYLDINSLYPHVMAAESYPVRLIQNGGRASVDVLNGWLSDGLAVIANVLIETEEPVFPHQAEKLIFPIGTYWGTLSTPELRYALDHGMVKAVGEYALYEQAPIFVDYVETIYNLRLEYRAAGDERFAFLAKFLLNSLYGKFGQTGKVWQDTGEEREQEGSIWLTEEYPGGPVRKQRVRMGKVQQLSSEEETDNSFPGVAAHVTAYARMLLWELFTVAGRENVYYTDTDSLIVNLSGFRKLKAAGWIDEQRLGALKVEDTTRGATFRGAKDYIIGETEHIKGVSKRATQTGPNDYEQDRFYSWDYLAARGRDGFILVERMHKTLKRNYDKGTVTDKGRVEPIRLSESSTYCRSGEGTGSTPIAGTRGE